MANDNIRGKEKKQLQAIKDYIDETTKNNDTKIYPISYFGSSGTTPPSTAIHDGKYALIYNTSTEKWELYIFNTSWKKVNNFIPENCYFLSAQGIYHDSFMLDDKNGQWIARPNVFWIWTVNDGESNFYFSFNDIYSIYDSTNLDQTIDENNDKRLISVVTNTPTTTNNKIATMDDISNIKTKKDTKIDISYPKFYYSDDVDVTIKLMEKDTSIPLSNKPVILNTNGSISAPINTDANGVIVKKLEHVTLTNFKMGAEFEGDDFYNGSSISDVEIDYSLHTDILAPPISINSGEDATLDINLSSKMDTNYVNMANRKIYIVDNDAVIGFLTTDANGVVQYKINNVTIDHKIKLKYTPEENDFRYDGAELLTYILIKDSDKVDTHFINTDMTMVVNTNGVTEILVLDVDDKKVSTGEIVITEGNDITLLDIDKSPAKDFFYTIKNTSTSHQIFLHYYDNTGTYNSCSKTINITIIKNKITPILTIDPLCIAKLPDGSRVDHTMVKVHLIDPTTNTCLIDRWVSAECGTKNYTTQIADCDIDWPLEIFSIVDGEKWIVKYDPTNQPQDPTDTDKYNGVSKEFTAINCSDTPLTVESKTLEINTIDTEGENIVTSASFDIEKQNGSGELHSDTLEVN